MAKRIVRYDYYGNPIYEDTETGELSVDRTASEDRAAATGNAPSSGNPRGTATTAAPPPQGPSYAQATYDNAHRFATSTLESADAARRNVGGALSTLYEVAGGVGDQMRADAAAHAQTAQGYEDRQAPQLDTAQSDLARQQQQETLQRIRAFQAQQSGLAALRAFAQQPEGPSAAEAQLRNQAARDRRAALSIARSARGGPAAVAQAMQVAQAEQAAIGAETRGQAAIVRATEDAQRRGESLRALEAVAQGESAASGQQISALTAEGNLITGTRGQDLEAARASLDARLQTLGLNDQQVRFFSGLSQQARNDAANAVLNAASKGIDTQLALEQVQMQYVQMAWNMLTDAQRLVLEEYAIRMGVKMNDAQQRTQFIGSLLGFAGMGLTAAATAFGGPPAGAAAAVGTQAATQAFQS